MTPDFESPDPRFIALEGDGVTKKITAGVTINYIQPGNNFIIASHLSDRYLNKIDFGDDKKTLKEEKGGADLPAAYRSATLTIWRSLSVERHNMATPTADDYAKSVAPSRFKAGKFTKDGDSVFQTELTVHDVGCLNQFAGGTVTFLDKDGEKKGTFKIITNTDGANARFQIDGKIPDEAVTFENLDDDDIARGVKAADMEPDVSVLAKYFAPACVLVKPERADLAVDEKGALVNVNKKDLPFQLNFSTKKDGTDRDKNVSAFFKANRKSEPSQAFWVAYMVGAYQGAVHQDVDPTSEAVLDYAPLATAYLETPDDVSGIILYAESAKDSIDSRADNPLLKEDKMSWPNARRYIPLHEMGHLFGMDHKEKDGPVMVYSSFWAAENQAQLDALGFAPYGFWRIMTTYYPGRPAKNVP